MARTKRSAKMDTWSARKKLPAGKMNQEPLAPGHYLAYRRPESGAAGTWSALWRHNKKIQQERLGTADDFATADGEGVLTYAQAQAMAQKWFQARSDEARTAHDGIVRRRGPFTVADAMSAYFERQDAKSKAAGYGARAIAKVHILPSLGVLEVERLSRFQLEKWLDTLATSPRVRKSSNSPRHRKAQEHDETRYDPPSTPEALRARKSTANRVLATLKAALNYARSRELVRCADDAWKFVRPFEGVSVARQSFLNPEEQQRLLNAIKEPDFWNLVFGALVSGCRYGELCKMRVGDFDAQSQTILIPESKNGHYRFVYLTDAGTKFIEGITAGRPSTEAIFQRTSVDRIKPAETGSDPLAWRTSEQSPRMHDACDVAGLPRMGFHQLRHSFASNLATLGVPLQIVASLTGHKDSRMTERHYSHIAPSEIKRYLEATSVKFEGRIPSVENLRIKKAGA